MYVHSCSNIVTSGLTWEIWQERIRASALLIQANTCEVWDRYIQVYMLNLFSSCLNPSASMGMSLFGFACGVQEFTNLMYICTYVYVCMRNLWRILESSLVFLYTICFFTIHFLKISTLFFFYRFLSLKVKLAQGRLHKYRSTYLKL